jgi:hypothetical protein
MSLYLLSDELTGLPTDYHQMQDGLWSHAQRWLTLSTKFRRQAHPAFNTIPRVTEPKSNLDTKLRRTQSTGELSSELHTRFKNPISQDTLDSKPMRTASMGELSRDKNLDPIAKKRLMKVIQRVPQWKGDKYTADHHFKNARQFYRATQIRE